MLAHVGVLEPVLDGFHIGEVLAQFIFPNVGGVGREEQQGRLVPTRLKVSDDGRRIVGS